MSVIVLSCYIYRAMLNLLHSNHVQEKKDLPTLLLLFIFFKLDFYFNKLDKLRHFYGNKMP